MDPTAFEALIAFFVPLVVAVVKQAGYPTAINAVIAIVIYVVFGVLAVVANAKALTLDNIVPAVELFTVVGTSAYYAFWRNIGEPKLLAATSFRK